MPEFFSRRNFLQVAGAGLLAGSRLLRSQEEAPPALPQPTKDFGRSKVVLVQGEERRKTVLDALLAADDQIRPQLKRRKYVVIKPNDTSTVNQLASTHADCLRAILDYLEPRFKGPVVIAEAASGNTPEGYDNFGYNKLPAEYRRLKVSLEDLNQVGKYGLFPLINWDLHANPIRIAARLLDPDAFVICPAITKSHNSVIATMAVKNMVLGSALRSAPNETPKWSDKPKFHAGVRQMNYNIFLVAQRLVPNWGLAVIDGFEGMEGNGPVSGTPVPHKIAIVSTDFVAADRVAAETMGVNADWIGYLNYCGQFGVGQYDLAKIDVQEALIAQVKRPYRLHQDVDRQLKWLGPLTEEQPRV